MVKIIFFSFILIYSSLIISQQYYSSWETVFEKSGYISTADYNQTMEYFQKLADSSEYADLFSFGVSPQNRELKYLLVTKETKKYWGMDVNMGLRKLSKPVILLINGIHSGEIEGKDASMLLLKEILVTKQEESLLDSLNIIVVPIFSVDGHERKSKYNRINQNGPEEMGWRTTAQNLNLNRDWMKADAPEMQSMLKLVNEWNPDFIIDTHTTDGADYQYTVTYAMEWYRNNFERTSLWLKYNFAPFLESGVMNKGFLIYRYVFLKDWDKGLEEGLIDWPATPRFSTGYFALRNRPVLLVETHMLKPYGERVFATKAVLETALNFVYNNSSKLLELNEEADKRSDYLHEENKYLPLSFSQSDKFTLIKFKGYEYFWDSSAISGAKKIVYTDNKKDFEIKFYDDIIVTDSVKIAKGYYIPAEYSFLKNKLELHGIHPIRLMKDTSIQAIRYKFNDVKFSEAPYEGRQTVTFNYENYEEKVNLTAGSFYVPTNQRTIKIITHLLEPKSADSFVRWGFMNQIFEQKEYYEDYVMEKLAEEMLLNDPELKKDFEEKLKNDEVFRNSSKARLDFFYERSPYPDKQLNVYPILRVE